MICSIWGIQIIMYSKALAESQYLLIDMTLDCSYHRFLLKESLEIIVLCIIVVDSSCVFS